MGKCLAYAAISFAAAIVMTIPAVAAQTELENALEARCETPSGAVFADGAIPNVKTASAVALEILNSVYGPKTIVKQLPLRVIQKADKYVVEGVLPPHSVGGTAEMILCRTNGAIVYLNHSK